MHRSHKSILNIHPQWNMSLKHNHIWRWYKAAKVREGVVVFIVVVKGFYVFAIKETLSPRWEIFIFHRRVQWAQFLLIGCTFLDRSTAAHSHTLKLSQLQLLYTEHLYYSSWRPSALLKDILTLIAFECVLAMTFQSPSRATLLAFWHKSNKYLSNLHIFAEILTNPINYLLLCYDVSSFIMSVIGFYTQQAEVKQTQGESGC